MATKHTLTTVLSFALLTVALTASAAPTIPPLTHPPTNKHVPGRFVWGDLFTTDPAAATAYYTQLFGWTSRTLEEDGKAYTILSLDDRPIAGIAKGPASPTGEAAARWIGYISVRDVDRAARAVKSRRGRVLLEPRDAPDRGRLAIVADNEGAYFGLIHSSSGDPEDYLAEPNQWMWITLFAVEPRDVIPFYRSVAGWEAFDDYRTTNPDDYVLSAGGYARAGVSKIGAASKPVPTWVGFVRVENVKAMTARAVELGGKTLLDSRTITAGNEIALIADPQGAIFGLAAFLEESEAR